MSGLIDWVAHSFNCICRHIGLGVAAGCMHRLPVQQSSSPVDTFIHELVIMSSSFRSSNTIHFKCTCSQVPEQTDPRPAFTCSSKSVSTDVKQIRGKWQHLSAPLGKYSQFQQCNTDRKPVRWLRTCICPLTTNIWFTSEGRGRAMSRSCLKLTEGGGGRSVWSQPKTIPH